MDASHGLTGPRALAGRSRKRVAILHIKRLGPTKSSSHRTEVQILVPTPSPSLRGHNWSTALLAARVRFRDYAGSDSRPLKDGPSNHSTMSSTNSAAVAQRRVTVAGRGDRPPALVGGRPRASPRMTEVEARGPHSVAEVATASAAWRHRVRRRGKPHLRQSSCGGCGSSRQCQGRPVRRHPAVETASVGYEGNLSRRAPQSDLLDPVHIVGPKQHPKGSLRLHVVRRRHGASIERHSRVKVAESQTRRPEEVECGCQHQRPQRRTSWPCPLRRIDRQHRIK